MASSTDTEDTDLDVLSRPGGNDQVVGKKVLLAHLAREEAARIGITPNDEQVREMGNIYCRQLGLNEQELIQTWLMEAGITQDEFYTVIADFAAILAVEAHYQERLAERVDLHQRLLNARSQRLAEKPPPPVIP